MCSPKLKSQPEFALPVIFSTDSFQQNPISRDMSHLMVKDYNRVHNYSYVTMMVTDHPLF